MTTRTKLGILTVAIIMIALILMACSANDMYIVLGTGEGDNSEPVKTTDNQQQDTATNNNQKDQPTQEQVNEAIEAAQEHGAQCLMTGTCEDD